MKRYIALIFTLAFFIDYMAVGDTPTKPLPSQTGHAGEYLQTDGTSPHWNSVSGTGTVTSVDVTVPSYMSISGNPVTTSGTLVFDFTSQAANKFFSSPNGSAGAPDFRTIVAADIPTLNQNTTGNANTATALAANPADCSSGQYANAIAANGDLTCAQVAYSDLSGSPSLHYQTVQANTSAQTQRSNLNFTSNFSLADSAGSDRTTVDLAGTITATLTGNASTATALASNPADCSAGQYANAIAANGDLTCAQVGYSQISGSPTIYYQTVQADTTPQTQRSNLNYSANFSLSDSSGSNRTTIDLASIINISEILTPNSSSTDVQGITLQTGDASSTANAGAITFQGGRDVNHQGGSILLYGGDGGNGSGVGAGDGGDIILSPGGTDNGNNGIIRFQRADEGTIGHIWTEDTVDGGGHWAAIGNAASATNATNATNGTTVATSSNASFYPLFVASSSNGNQPFNLDTTFTYNPSTDTLTAATFSGALSGNATTATSATSATNATNTAITDDTTTNATMYPTWVTTTTGNLPQKISSTKLTFNPSTATLTATTFSGALSGNATTATTATSATTATTATNATNVATTSTSSNASFYPLFVASSSNGNQAADLGTGLTFNPSTNTLATTTFSGALSGNATTASALAADPSDCSSNNYATGIAASGNLTCGQVSLTAGVSGILPVANGGTGIASGTSGGILGYTASGTIASSGALTQHAIVLGGGAGATPGVLGSLGTTTTILHGAAAGDPTWSAVSLANDVTGTLGVGSGGTGQTSYTNGQLLIGNTTGNTLAKATITAGTGIAVTNGAGTITIAASGGAAGGPAVTIKTSTPAATGWIFTISTSSTLAVGDTYTNNGNTYTVMNSLSAQSGQVLCALGTGATSGTTLTRATGSGTSSITFSAKSAIATYTPGNSNYLEIEAIGGGGGGGGAANVSGNGGGGGGSGAYVRKVDTNQAAATQGYGFMVGTNGSAGDNTGANGSAGGTTAVCGGSVLMLAGGGSLGGQATSGNAFHAGGAGGTTASGGDFGIPGGDGQSNSIPNGGTTGYGGTGGNGYFGGGGRGGFNGVTTPNPGATNSGAGGGGGGASSGGQAGGAGAVGLIVFKSY